MEQNKTTFIVVGALALGLIIGYYFGGNNLSHMMSSGSMMNSDSLSMEHAMDSMNAGLIGKTGDDFDKAFLTEMIVHHQGAVEMAQLALTSAKHKEIKDLAVNIITAQNVEIGSMKGWLQSWYK